MSIVIITPSIIYLIAVDFNSVRACMEITLFKKGIFNNSLSILCKYTYNYVFDYYFLKKMLVLM